MLLKVFAVYDSKVEAFMTPFFMNSRGQAIRAFSDTAKDSSTQISKHPSDFTLFELGVYNDSNASFDLHIAPISCGIALELLGVS